MSTQSTSHFSRRTILSAIDLLNRLTHAKLTRFLLDLGPDVAGEIGEQGSVEARLNKLIWYVAHFPSHCLDDGRSIYNAIIDKAVEMLPEQSPWSEPRPDEAAFLRGLERDGFTVTDSQLRRAMPAELQLPQAESEIERLLSKYDLTTAKGHLDQARDAHARGDWAAANAQTRTFIEALCDSIAEKIDPAGGQLPSGHARREKLAQLGFLSAGLNEWEASGKGFFNGLIRRLHPQGSHPGLSDEEDSTFRLHIVMLSARLLLARLDQRGGR